MNTYTITYSFDGNGTAIVQAKNKKEAEEKFFEGNATYSQEENTDSYNIFDITKN